MQRAAIAIKQSNEQLNNDKNYKKLQKQKKAKWKIKKRKITLRARMVCGHAKQSNKKQPN